MKRRLWVLSGFLVLGFLGSATYVVGNHLRHKPRQNILYTSAEINRLDPAPECLYAVDTSSKSHNCSAGHSKRA
jgi:hypothetical protein